MIALIALRNDDPPSLRELSEHVRNRFGEAAEISLDEESGAVRMALGEDHVVLSSSATVIPPQVWEAPCRTAWYWPTAAETFERHDAHIAVVIPTEGTNAKLRSMLLTRLVDNLGEEFGAVAVYWEPAAMVHSFEAFHESAEQMSEKQIPLRVWVRFQLIENDDNSHSLFTQGLQPLGFLELEVRQSRRPAENIYGWAFNIAHYLLERGELVEDGHTVGVNPTEWIRIHHLPSAIDEERTVLFLDLDLDEEMDAATDLSDLPR